MFMNSKLVKEFKKLLWKSLKPSLQLINLRKARREREARRKRRSETTEID